MVYKQYHCDHFVRHKYFHAADQMITRWSSIKNKVRFARAEQLWLWASDFSSDVVIGNGIPRF